MALGLGQVAAIMVFIARQKRGFAICNAIVAANESFRRDFFAWDRKKMIELTSLVMLFVDRAQKGAE
jgi:hypothetical protein